MSGRVGCSEIAGPFGCDSGRREAEGRWLGPMRKGGPQGSVATSRSSGPAHRSSMRIELRQVRAGPAGSAMHDPLIVCGRITRHSVAIPPSECHRSGFANRSPIQLTDISEISQVLVAEDDGERGAALSGTQDSSRISADSSTPAHALLRSRRTAGSFRDRPALSPQASGGWQSQHPRGLRHTG